MTCPTIRFQKRIDARTWEAEDLVPIVEKSEIGAQGTGLEAIKRQKTGLKRRIRRMIFRWYPYRIRKRRSTAMILVMILILMKSLGELSFPLSTSGYEPGG